MVSPTAKTVSGGFQFITSINTISRDDETRRKVRSHARRQKLPSQGIEPQPKDVVTQKDRTSKFRLSAAKPANNKKQSSPTSRSNEKSSPSSSDSSVELKIERLEEWETEMITSELALTVVRELPTFAVLPIQTTALTDNLFKYIICVCLSPQEKFVQKWFDRCGAPTYFQTYHSSFLANSHAMNPQGNWFDFITVDPAMTHAFMGMIAAMHNALADWEDTTTINFHRYEAVKYINKRLHLEGKDFNSPVSDGVIVAVSLLVNVEAFIGSLASAKAHMNGLKKMIDLRGGIIDGFWYSTLLQRALTWADFAYATASDTPLSFPFIPALASSLKISDQFMSRSLMINTQPSRPSSNDLTIRNRDAIELFELLYSTTEAVNGFEFARLEDLREQRGQMSDCIYLIDWRLCKLEESSRARRSRTMADPLPLFDPSTYTEADEEATSAQYDSPTDISDALVYATHLFLHLAIRGQPPAARRHKALLEAMMTNLCGTLACLDLLLDSSIPSSTVAATPSESLEITSCRSSMDSWPTSVSESSEASPVELKSVLERDELHDDILLWILFVGACVRVPASAASSSTFSFEAILFGDHLSFFICALRKLCRNRGIRDMETLAARLKRVIWLNSWCEKQLEMVWPRIADDFSVA